MRTSVKFVKERYTINKEQGVVVCIMECSIDDSTYLSNGERVWNHVPRLLCNKLEKKLGLNNDNFFKVKGVAKCHKEDTFDETLGKRIAESKAKKQAFSKAALYYSTVADNISRVLDDIVTLEENCYAACDREWDHLKKLENKII